MKISLCIPYGSRCSLAAAPPGLFPAQPCPPHLLQRRVVSVETRESQLSLQTRCYPDNGDLA